jgi:RNA polymerase sigma factor (sigma-70 family)
MSVFRPPELFFQAQRYLTHREQRLPIGEDLEGAWKTFYDLYSRKIRSFAFSCGAREEEIWDCVQEVWTELLVRLPRFRLDPKRGKFDTWLFHIVRGKTANFRRSHKPRPWEGDSLLAAIAYQQSPAWSSEDEEIFAVFWEQVRKSLSECSFQVLEMRLLQQRPVAEVADTLGLSHEQVWYRYHRARRQAQQIAAAWSRHGDMLLPREGSSKEKLAKRQESAQGNSGFPVSRGVRSSSRARPGGNCVDYVFQRLELGRRDLTPEWKVEWNCDVVPRPVLYIRKSAIVAYAEICSSGDFITSHWPRIVNAAISAGVAAGIATIIATPTAALPVFQKEFHKQLQGKGAMVEEERVQVALSAKQEANGPWCECKD